MKIWPKHTLRRLSAKGCYEKIKKNGWDKVRLNAYGIVKQFHFYLSLGVLICLIQKSLFLIFYIVLLSKPRQCYCHSLVNLTQTVPPYFVRILILKTLRYLKLDLIVPLSFIKLQQCNRFQTSMSLKMSCVSSHYLCKKYFLFLNVHVNENIGKIFLNQTFWLRC